ncbi:hypothetical protein SGCOL_007102 [Colletotrichum sp. CLE4]
MDQEDKKKEERKASSVLDEAEVEAEEGSPSAASTPPGAPFRATRAEAPSPPSPVCPRLDRLRAEDLSDLEDRPAAPVWPSASSRPAPRPAPRPAAAAAAAPAASSGPLAVRAAPASRTTNGLASKTRTVISVSSASSASPLGSAQDDFLEQCSLDGDDAPLRGPNGEMLHASCTADFYNANPTPYGNVNRCTGHHLDPSCKDQAYCSRERKCRNKRHFKDALGRINHKNCSHCRAVVKTKKIRDTTKREAKIQELVAKMDGVPFRRGAGKKRNAKGKKKGLGKNKTSGKKVNSGRKAAAGSCAIMEETESEAEVESGVESLGMDLPDQRPGFNKHRRDSDSDEDDTYGANGKGGFSGFGGGNGSLPVAAC